MLYKKKKKKLHIVNTTVYLNQSENQNLIQKILKFSKLMTKEKLSNMKNSKSQPYGLERYFYICKSDDHKFFNMLIHTQIN